MDNLDGNTKVKVIIKDKGNLLANINVSFDTIKYGFITIKGFQVWQSKVFNDRLQEAINIKPPSKQAYGKYYQQVFIESPSKWFELEIELYDAFNAARNKTHSQNEEIDIDEVAAGIEEAKQKESNGY